MPARPARLRPLVAAAVLALLASAGTARANNITTMNISDSELPGLFTGSVTYNWTSPTAATLTISLKNVSPTANGGFITAVAFNDPNNTDPAGNGKTNFNTVTLASGPANFSRIGSTTTANTISGSPFGNFDLAVSNSTQVLGGGSPNTGIGVNQTGTFVFNIAGSGLNAYSAEEFLRTYSTDNSSALLVRFRGFNNGLSDKDVIGKMNPGGGGGNPPPPPPPGGNAVPAPPAVVLAGVGFGCLLLGRLRRRAA